jgi:hypothetical protein
MVNILRYPDIMKTFPMYIERYCRMLRYWFKLLYTDNCILKCLYEDMLESSELKPNAIKKYTKVHKFITYINFITI